MIENVDRELSAERLMEVGKKIEKNISNNEGVFLSIEDARSIRESMTANWNVFKEGVRWDLDGETIEVTPENAMTGKVLNARALLVLGAIGQERMVATLLEGLAKAIEVKGGGIWKGSQRELTPEVALKFAREFVELSCDIKNFRFSKEVSDEQENILHRLEASVNVLYYTLALSSLAKENTDVFELAQRDWLLSGNIRFPVLKGIERSKESEDRVVVPGFAQMAPIRHLSPGCLGVMMKSLA